LFDPDYLVRDVVILSFSSLNPIEIGKQWLDVEQISDVLAISSEHSGTATEWVRVHGIIFGKLLSGLLLAKAELH
jgi:hypothetical protein